MPRRRFRIVLQQDEKPRTVDYTVTDSATVSPAAQLTQADPAPRSLNPAQQRLIQMQQQMGNRHTLGQLGKSQAGGSLIQRATLDLPDDLLDEVANGSGQTPDQQLAQEKVNAPSGVQGVNDPQNTRSLLMAAAAAYKDKKYGVALLAFQTLFPMDRAAKTLINIALCELRLDLFDEAIENLEIALSDDNLDREERSRAMSLLESAKKLKDVESVGFMSLPSNVDTENSPLGKEPRAIRNQIFSLYRTAEGAAKSEDYEASLTAFKLAQTRLPHPANLINIGKTLVMLQRYSEASTAFELAKSDRTLGNEGRKIAEIELEVTKRFQGQRLDAVN